jgi:hypothetical protein
MRNFGMRRGQQLMETWFSRHAARYPYYSRSVTNIIAMDWVLSFERVRNVYDNSDKRRCMKEIAQWLDREKLLGIPKRSASDAAGPDSRLSRSQLSTRTVRDFRRDNRHVNQ